MLASSRVRSRRSAGSCFASSFEQMIPQIRRHLRSAINGTEPRSRDQLHTGVIANTFDIFNRLEEHELSDLAYLWPLPMASLVGLRQTRS